MPTGLLLGLGAALFWGMTDVTAAVAGRRLGSLRVVLVSQSAGLVLAIVLAIALGEGLPSDPGVTLAAALVGLAGAGAYLAFFTALRIGPLAVVSPITGAYGGLTIVLAVLLLHESLEPLQAVGAAVAVGGVLLAGLHFDEGLRSPRIVGRGVLFAVVALVLFALMTVGSTHPIRTAGWLPVVLVNRIATVAAAGVLLLLADPLKVRPLAPLLSAPLPPARSALAIALFAGVLDLIGLVSFGVGLEVADTWLVGLASSFGPAIAVVVGVGFLGERLRASQWLGLGGIGAGLVIVAIA